MQDLYRKMQLLDNILIRAYIWLGSGKSAPKSILRQKLSWGTEQRNEIDSVRDSLRSAAKMAFPRFDQVMFVYTNAGKEQSAVVVAQTKREQLRVPVKQQQYKPIAFGGDEFLEQRGPGQVTNKRHTLSFKQFTYLIICSGELVRKTHSQVSRPFRKCFLRYCWGTTLQQMCYPRCVDAWWINLDSNFWSTT